MPGYDLLAVVVLSTNSFPIEHDDPTTSGVSHTSSIRLFRSFNYLLVVASCVEHGDLTVLRVAGISRIYYYSPLRPTFCTRSFILKAMRT